MVYISEDNDDNIVYVYDLQEHAEALVNKELLEKLILLLEEIL